MIDQCRVLHPNGVDDYLQLNGIDWAEITVVANISSVFYQKTYV